MITIYDLARDAQVSAATVSRALNHPELVSEATRERVLASARRLGYWASGRKHAKGTTGVTVVGAIGPFSSLSSAQQQLNGILERARVSAVEVVAHDHEHVRLTAKGVAGLPIAGRVDGLIVTDLSTTPSAVVALRALDIPTVLLGSEHPELPSVSTDHRAGVVAVVDLLLDLHPASFLLVGLDAESTNGRHFLAPETQNTHDTSARLKGVITELRDRGVHTRPDAIVRGSENIGETTRAIAAALTGRPLPLAVFAVTDELATAAVRAAAQLGLTIAKDVFVIGYGDSSVSDALAITSVREPLTEAGHLALDMVVALTFGEDVDSLTRLEPTVIARSTTSTA